MDDTSKEFLHFYKENYWDGVGLHSLAQKENPIIISAIHNISDIERSSYYWHTAVKYYCKNIFNPGVDLSTLPPTVGRNLIRMTEESLLRQHELKKDCHELCCAYSSVKSGAEMLKFMEDAGEEEYDGASKEDCVERMRKQHNSNVRKLKKLEKKFI